MKLLRLLPLSTLALVLPLAAKAQESTRLVNPLGDTDDLRVVIGRVISALLGLSGAIALLMFVYGGILWMTSGGNSDRIQKGKTTLVWAVIGLVVIFTAQTLVRLVIRALTAGQAS